MIKINAVWIFIVVSILVIAFYFRSDYESKIKDLEDRRASLEEVIDNLFLDIKEKDIIIEITRERISEKQKIIDSLKLKEDEIKTPDFIDIPIDQRNITIERLASEE